jgi:hypothetical protein
MLFVIVVFDNVVINLWLHELFMLLDMSFVNSVVDGLHPLTSLLLMSYVGLVLCPVGGHTVGVRCCPWAYNGAQAWCSAR